MRKTAVAVSICLVLAPRAALAWDWTIRSTQSETVELNSNPLLKQNPAGAVGSYSTLTADAEARTPTSIFDFSGDGTYRKNWGPGYEGGATESLNYGFNTRYEHREKTAFDREFIDADWRQQSTALAILNDLGISTRIGGFIDRLTYSGGLDRSLSHLDTVSLFATSTQTSYEPSSGGQPFTDTLAQGSWRHSLNPVAAVNFSSQAELLSYSNALATQVQIYRNQIGADLSLTKLLSFRFSAGPIYVETQNGAPSTGPSRPIPSAATDWIADATLTYRMFKDTTATILATQTIGPSIVGSLTKRDIVTGSLAYTINSHSSLSFSAGWNRQIALTNRTDFGTASATYAYSFTPEWTAQFNYRYQHRFASNGTATLDPVTGTPILSGTAPVDSHSILMVVTHSYVVLPPGY